MNLIHAGDRPSIPAGDMNFTGTVRFDPIDTGDPDCTVKILLVTFEPNARTDWHTHPAGQTLHIVSGMGLAGSDGQPVRVLRPGDTVWFAPGERHWHGASPDCGMTHIAVQAIVGGTSVSWMEKVSDADYTASRAGAD